jgi:hypothetical protein
LFLRVTPDHIVSENWITANPEIFEQFLMKNEDTYIFYELDDECTYQDYIALFDLAFSTVYGLREKAMAADTSLTELGVRKKYPLRIININHPLTTIIRPSQSAH